MLLRGPPTERRRRHCSDSAIDQTGPVSDPGGRARAVGGGPNRIAGSPTTRDRQAGDDDEAAANDGAAADDDGGAAADGGVEAIRRLRAAIHHDNQDAVIMRGGAHNYGRSATQPSTRARAVAGT